jgi:HD-like signal output (HDOD) protein
MGEDKEIDNELEQVLLHLGIPPCPKILLELLAEAKNEEPDLNRIEKLICADVGLSAALIKTINSPFYGLRIKVHSVMQAIHMLGLSHLSMMVMGMMLRDTLKGMGQLDLSRFWDASSKIAIISSYIAGRLPYLAFEHVRREINKDIVYTYGLFQDCGIPILLNRYATYKDTLMLANQTLDKKFTDVEDVEYVNNHATVGYLLAKSWGLPENMIQAIRYHHEHRKLTEDTSFLSVESRDFIALALLAERSIQVITDLSQSCEWAKGESWVMQHFGLTEAELNSIIKGIRILYEEGNLNS